MAVQQNKKSRSRRDMRRSHDALTNATLSNVTIANQPNNGIEIMNDDLSYSDGINGVTGTAGEANLTVSRSSISGLGHHFAGTYNLHRQKVFLWRQMLSLDRFHSLLPRMCSLEIQNHMYQFHGKFSFLLFSVVDHV